MKELEKNELMKTDGGFINPGSMMALEACWSIFCAGFAAGWNDN